MKISPEEADRLSTDATLNALLDQIRLEALNDLAGVEADNMISVLRLQQKVSVVDEIRSGLRASAARPANSKGTFA